MEDGSINESAKDSSPFGTPLAISIYRNFESLAKDKFKISFLVWEETELEHY